MTKITDLAALTGVATTDLITAVDVSDTSMAASGTNKKVTLSELITFLRGNGLVSDAGDTMTGALVLPADPTAALEAATKQYVDTSVSGGIGTVNAFTFNSTTTAPPIGNQIRFNNATQSSTTVIWISQTTFDGLDVSIGLSRIADNWQFYMQDYDDSTQWILFDTTDVGTDEGTYWSFPVTYSAGPGIPTQKIAVQTVTPGNHGLPSGGADGDVLTKTSSSDYAAAWEAPTGGTPAASAISFTPAGTIAATDVQAAIVEVAAEAGAGTVVKLSALTAMGASSATGDLIEVVDISDSTMAGTGTNKKLMLSELVTFLAANGLVADADITGFLASATAATTYAPIRRPIVANTGTTLAPVLGTHENVMVTMSNAATQTITLPSDATSNFPVGAETDYLWLGVGQPVFAAGGGATVNSESSWLKIRARYTAVTAKKTAANTWVLLGALAA